MTVQVLNQRYELTQRLGGGAQGDVYLATDTKLDREVAIKILKWSPGKEIDESARRELRREAKVTARFKHPQVVSLYDYDLTDTGVPFLVMERLEGQTLDGLPEPLTRDELRMFVTQVASALQKAHDMGMVHRDLKPSNIMLVDRGQPEQRFVILDLGIAKLTDVAQELATLGQLTYTGAGTPHYMAPEQVQRESIDHRADVYAFGSILYEFLTGRPPFAAEAESLYQLLNAVVETPTKPIAEALGCDTVSDALGALIDGCLAKDPAARPQSMREVADRFLQVYVAESTADATEDSAEVRLPPAPQRVQQLATTQPASDAQPSALAVHVVETLPADAEAPSHESATGTLRPAAGNTVVAAQPKAAPAAQELRTNTEASVLETRRTKKRSRLLWGGLAVVTICAALGTYLLGPVGSSWHCIADHLRCLTSTWPIVFHRRRIAMAAADYISSSGHSNPFLIGCGCTAELESRQRYRAVAMAAYRGSGAGRLHGYRERPQWTRASGPGDVAIAGYRGQRPAGLGHAATGSASR